MKKLILTLLLAIFANQCLAGTEHFYTETLKVVGKHEQVDIRPYLNASYHVARMWKDFPSSDYYQRVSCFMGYGGAESNFEKDYVNINIPGKPYPGLHGLKVKRFSVDYSWAGLNEQAVIPTYTVARALQTGHKMSHKELRRLGLRPDLYEVISKVLVVPKGMKLYKIDLNTADLAYKQYLSLKKAHVSPRHMSITIPYTEPDQDAIDSVLLYRTIEEYDRSLRGWPYQSYDSDAYKICQQIISEP